MEYRYYQMPEGSPLLALLGQKWTQSYGKGIDYLHFHNYLEIGYCYEGQGELVIAEKSYHFTGNQFSVIPPNCPHTTNSDPGTKSRWEYLYIDVEGTLRGLYSEGGSEKQKERILGRINSQAFLKEHEKASEIADRILLLMNSMREQKEFYLEEAKGILLSLLVALARENQNNVLDMDVQMKTSMPSMLVSEALDYISEHYMEPIRIEKLASVCYVSETHFRRVFSSSMNMAPLEYINMVRIQNACDLLKKTNDTVASIAYRCGFSTLPTFNRNFKQATGVSPMEWRKQPDKFEQQILKFTVHTEEGW